MTVLIPLTLLAITLFLRLSNLGYSDFYGDETKTLYLNKTIPAVQFFMDQRKGPVQFIAAWVMEKAVGSYDEFFIRLPFALANISSILIFFFLIKRLFNTKVAAVSSFLLLINGFSVAFGRTAQYQSFLLLFGLLSLYFLVLFIENTSKKYLLTFSFFFLALGVLSHYDGIFYIIPFLVIMVSNYSGFKKNNGIVKWLLFSITLFLILVSLFYLPYYLNGNFSSNSLGYLSRRISGNGYVSNNSLYTAKVYNPFFIPFIPLFFSLFGFAGQLSWKKTMLILWFVVPFIVFEFIFLNPGTHIFNYLIPVIILAGLGIVYVWDAFRSVLVRKLFVVFLGSVFVVNLTIITWVYVPGFNKGYPWKIFRPNLLYHVYLYGFPYNRQWKDIGQYLKSKGARSFYTNDNTTIGEYYLYGIPSTPLIHPQYPEYYIYIVDGQLMNNLLPPSMDLYSIDKEFYNENELTAVIYKYRKD